MDSRQWPCASGRVDEDLTVCWRQTSGIGIIQCKYGKRALGAREIGSWNEPNDDVAWNNQCIVERDKIQIVQWQ